MIRVSLLSRGCASRPFYARYMAALNSNQVPVYDRSARGWCVGSGKRYTTKNKAIFYGAKIT